ncbi:MAG: FAD binding domain-containing protein [Phycisphaerae bacterium]|nr:FAD binding domain-containing protein [Phycisphaerae bacterium]
MFYQPQTLEEALELRGRLRDEAIVVKGGTDVLVAMNHGVLRPRSFLDLSQVKGFDVIERDDGWISMGAGATFAQVGQLDVGCLREAALSVGGPQIRNAGTIAGNLVSASPAGDGCVALLALDAQVEVASVARGSRWLRVNDEWFLAYRKTALADDELITRVRVRTDFQSAWYKIGKRGAVNISVVCCAVGRSPDGCYYLAFGSVAFRPIRTPQAEELLNGRALTDDLIACAAESVMDEVSPIDDQRAGAAYRRAMCGVLTRRLLRELDRM